MHRVTMLALVLLFIISNAVFSQPSPSVVAETVVYAQALYYNHTSHIARTSDGKLFAVWTSSGTDGQIVYSQYDPAFQFWSPAAPISTCPSGGAPHKAGIAADESGNLYVAWQQRNTTAEDYAIYFSKYNGSSWSAPVNLTGNDLENEEVGIDVDDQGNVYIGWNTDSEAAGSKWLLCLRSTDGGTTWLGPDTLSSSDGIIGAGSIESARPYFARGKNGKMVCTWFEVPDGGLNQEIFLNQFDGSTWGGEQIVSGITNDNNRYPAAVIDAADNIYVVYRPFEPRQSLVMKKKGWNDADWPAQADTVIAQGVEGYKPFLVMDDNENFYMVFRRNMESDTSNTLEQISYVTSSDKGLTWSEQILLSRDTYDAGYVTAASHVRSSGIDVLWREGYRPLVDDPDSLSIMYGHIDLLPVAIEDPENGVPQEFSLNQNYPNPFNPSTAIEFQIPNTEFTTLKVYNLVGQEIAVLVSKELSAGTYKYSWNAAGLASGVYIYRLQAGKFVESRKMLLLR